jgi:phage-related protein|tara:strand:- start:280 stop:522 length:243 start_codon:yes stop_codon:yes gene_type:complete
MKQKIKYLTKIFFTWLLDLFRTRYRVTVSFNKEYGDADDRTYITKKIITKKEKHLKFKDEDNNIVEYRSAAGLNYIIEDA